MSKLMNIKDAQSIDGIINSINNKISYATKYDNSHRCVVAVDVSAISLADIVVKLLLEGYCVSLKDNPVNPHRIDLCISWYK